MKDSLSKEIENRNPKIVYLSGKTCSGKTTLSDKLRAQGYKRIHLDEIVTRSVIEPFNIKSHGNAFLTAYRGIGPKELTSAFVDATKKSIEKSLSTSQKIVIEGAIAKDWILSEIFSDHLDDLFFVYLLPEDIDGYANRIQSRFVAGVATNTSGLPKDFWEMVSDDDVNHFTETGKINGSLRTTFLKFATKSAKESAERLEHLKKTFPDIYVAKF